MIGLGIWQVIDNNNRGIRANFLNHGFLFLFSSVLLEDDEYVIQNIDTSTK